MPNRQQLPHIPIPSDLQKTQDWFASIITRPIDIYSTMNPISPSGVSMELEAPHYIAPSPTMRPHQRIQLYNQQYWWRLVTNMQEMFPLVTRLFGYMGFNQDISVPYLVKYPPDHWSLSYLGNNLSKWIKEEYHADDKKLVLDAADLDWAFNAAFIAKKHPPLDLSKLPADDNFAVLFSLKLYLQPHIHLFSWNYDLFAFRNTFLSQGPDYWEENDFPELPKEKPFFFILFRNSHNDIYWKEISAGQYHILRLLQTGTTVESVCHFLEQQDQDICEEASKHLHEWFQEWTIQGWLYSD